MAFIELKNVSKTYKNGNVVTVALQDINLNIEKGEFVAIMGASGSGKTTLLNIIGCMDTVTEGNYYFENNNISNASEKLRSEIRGNKISFIFQNFALLEDYTVFDNVQMPLIKRKLSRNMKKRIVNLALDRIGILDLAKKKASNLSGGQKQRVSIARAIACKADVILADEATGALDSKTSIEIMKIFEELNKEGKTIILITHSSDIASYAKRCITIKDGRILKDEKI